MFLCARLLVFTSLSDLTIECFASPSIRSRKCVRCSAKVIHYELGFLESMSLYAGVSKLNSITRFRTVEIQEICVLEFSAQMEKG